MVSVDGFEVASRRAKFAQISEAQQADPARREYLAVVKVQRERQAERALEILSSFQQHRDVPRLRQELDEWWRAPGYEAYGGVNGQMYLNQLIKQSPDAEQLGQLLAECIAAPQTAAAAAAAIRRLAEHTESVKVGAHPAPRRSLFLLSFFWSLQNPVEWPCFWPSAEKVLVGLGWLEKHDDYGDLYIAFREVVLSLGQPDVVEHALFWFDEVKYCGLDPSLIDRCRRALEIREQVVDDDYPSDETRAAALVNARAILGELAYLGEALEPEVANALGRGVKRGVPTVFWKKDVYRGDGWVRWSVGKDSNPSVRLWATSRGMFIGLHPGFVRAGWYPEVHDALQGLHPAGATPYPIRLDSQRIDETPDPSWRGDVLLGWRLNDDVVADAARFREAVIGHSAALQPALDKLAVLAGAAPSAPASTPDTADDPLRRMVARFIAERPYPSPRDETRKAEREQLAQLLATDAVHTMSADDFRSISSTHRYGSPGPQSVLNVTLRDATPGEFTEYCNRLHWLLWGDGDVGDRIDSMLDTNDKWIKGLGESVILKLLAIVQPERFLPVFPYTGESGKARMLKALGIPLPPSDVSAGHRQLMANDALRARLEPLLPGDAWAQAQFLYWYVEQPEEPEGTDVDVVAELADELLVDRAFIDEVVELLEDKRQVIFFGPPGTGKTYVARAIARMVAPDPGRRVVVQFHPSTSYEDFFEGYRPDESAGQLSYTLRKGPLATMAEMAEASPGVKHVMVIDEINRANLPKVFGELLYLLEYRGDEVSTLYRPDEKFTLPPNLYFVGTMNTADRSIALVDAALRRRFHFIPFFPDEGPMAGLLARWLERHKQPTWVAALVETVNSELISDLGGPDLQIGPSYFMREGLEGALPKIWKYNIEPLIADQLFGQTAKIKEYGFDKVMARFRKETGQPTGLVAVETAETDPAIAGAAGPPADEAPADEPNG